MSRPHLDQLHRICCLRHGPLQGQGNTDQNLIENLNEQKINSAAVHELEAGQPSDSERRGLPRVPQVWPRKFNLSWLKFLSFDY